MIQQKAKKKRD